MGPAPPEEDAAPRGSDTGEAPALVESPAAVDPSEQESADPPVDFVPPEERVELHVGMEPYKEPVPEVPATSSGPDFGRERTAEAPHDPPPPHLALRGP